MNIVFTMHCQNILLFIGNKKIIYLIQSKKKNSLKNCFPKIKIISLSENKNVSSRFPKTKMVTIWALHNILIADNNK